MGFTSNTYSQPIFGEHNWQDLVSQTMDFAKGYVQRDLSERPLGSLAMGNPFQKALVFPEELYIPRSEWPRLCEEREKRGALTSQVLRRRGVVHKNQARTNYCWANSVIAAFESRRSLLGLPYVPLSSASVAAPVKGYRNVGGWMGEAAEYASLHGIVPESLWPNAEINRARDNETSRAARAPYKLTLYYDLPTGRRAFDALMSALLHGFTAATGHIWWTHSVQPVDPLFLGRSGFGARFMNSWPNWGDEGYGIFEESRATPDGGVVIVDVT